MEREDRGREGCDLRAETGMLKQKAGRLSSLFFCITASTGLRRTGEGGDASGFPVDMRKQHDKMRT